LQNTTKILEAIFAENTFQYYIFSVVRIKRASGKLMAGLVEISSFMKNSVN